MKALFQLERTEKDAMSGATQVTMNRVGAVPFPANMSGSNPSLGILDGISNVSPPYRSAAIVFGPVQSSAMVFGIVSYDTSTNQYGVMEPPQGQGDATGWPSVDSFSAACGVSGGFVAFAKLNGQGNTPTIQVHAANPGLGQDGNWGIQYTIQFPSPGTIQCMSERSGKIYGFIKGESEQDNSFFIAKLPGPATVYPYQGAAAAAGFPEPTNGDIFNSSMLHTIAFDTDRVFAIDETYGSVLCATFDGSVTSHPLAKPRTIGLVIDEKLNKAYGSFPGSAFLSENVMPYTIDGQGGFHRGQDTITDVLGCCPAIDQTLHLLYLPGGPAAHFNVYDVFSDTLVTVTGDNPLTRKNFILFCGSLVSAGDDPTHSIFYVTGQTDKSEGSIPSILVYDCSVTRS